MISSVAGVALWLLLMSLFMVQLVVVVVTSLVVLAFAFCDGGLATSWQ